MRGAMKTSVCQAHRAQKLGELVRKKVVATHHLIGRRLSHPAEPRAMTSTLYAAQANGA
jgi:hypothetical protein